MDITINAINAIFFSVFITRVMFLVEFNSFGLSVLTHLARLVKDLENRIKDVVASKYYTVLVIALI